MRKMWFKPRFRTSKAAPPERERERESTYHFVLLAIPDGRAEQTLDLVAGVIWVFTLSEDESDNYSTWEKKRKEGREIKGIKEREIMY